MAARSIHVTDLRELIRLLRKGETDRRIARDLGLSRNTVAKYRSLARRHQLLGETLPSEAAIDGVLQSLRRDGRAAHETSSVEPFREQVRALVAAGVEGQAAWRILAEQHGFTGSYSSVKRFVRSLRGAQPPESFVRLEVAPGEEAQVDFGYAGVMHDSTRGTARRKPLSWTLGPGVREIAERTGADYMLTLQITDSYSSKGRVAMMLLGVALQVALLTGGQQGGIATLVDLKTGDVVWFNVMTDQMGDMRDAEGAAATARRLLKGLPL